jgi:hypothetical protein
VLLCTNVKSCDCCVRGIICSHIPSCQSMCIGTGTIADLRPHAALQALQLLYQLPAVPGYTTTARLPQHLLQQALAHLWAPAEPAPASTGASASTNASTSAASTSAATSASTSASPADHSSAPPAATPTATLLPLLTAYPADLTSAICSQPGCLASWFQATAAAVRPRLEADDEDMFSIVARLLNAMNGGGAYAHGIHQEAAYLKHSKSLGDAFASEHSAMLRLAQHAPAALQQCPSAMWLAAISCQHLLQVPEGTDSRPGTDAELLGRLPLVQGFTTQVLSNIDADDPRAVPLLRAILSPSVATTDVTRTAVQQLAAYAVGQDRVHAAVRVALQALAPLLQQQPQLARAVPLQQLWSVMCKAREQSHSSAVPGYVGWGASCFLSTSRALAQAGLAGPLVDLGCHETLAQMMVGASSEQWIESIAHPLHCAQCRLARARDGFCMAPAVRLTARCGSSPSARLAPACSVRACQQVLALPLCHLPLHVSQPVVCLQEHAVVLACVIYARLHPTLLAWLLCRWTTWCPAGQMC